MNSWTTRGMGSWVSQPLTPPLPMAPRNRKGDTIRGRVPAQHPKEGGAGDTTEGADDPRPLWMGPPLASRPIAYGNGLVPGSCANGRRQTHHVGPQSSPDGTGDVGVRMGGVRCQDVGCQEKRSYGEGRGTEGAGAPSGSCSRRPSAPSPRCGSTAPSTPAGCEILGLTRKLVGWLVLS